MDDLLLMEEMEEYSIAPESKSNAIEMRNLTVSWDVVEVYMELQYISSKLHEEFSQL